MVGKIIEKIVITSFYKDIYFPYLICRVLYICIYNIVLIYDIYED